MLLTDALAIEVGLDPKALRKGLAEVSTSMRKAKEGAQKDGAAIEKSLDGAAEAVDRLARNALKLFALFTAGRAVKDFVQDITSADAALGRLAKSIGSTPEAISSLANAVARGGGSAAATAGSFEKLSDSINEIKVSGNSSLLPTLGRLQGISGKTIRLNQDLATTFGDIADAAKGTADKMGAPFASYLLKQAGIDRDTAALLLQGREKLNEAIEKSRKVGIVKKEDSEAAQKLQTSIETLRQASESFGRSIMTNLTPVITDLLTRFQGWIEKNQEWLRSGIVDGVKQFANWIKGIDWDNVGKGLQNFGAAALKVADAFGGILKICEALLLFWVGSKAIRMVQAILGMAGLLGSGPLGWAIRLAMLGGAAMGSVDPSKSIVHGGVPSGSLNPSDELPGVGTDDARPRRMGIFARARRAVVERARRLRAGGDATAATETPGPSRPLGAVARNQNAQTIIATLKAAGYNDNAIAAVVGSMQTESSFNPRARNNVNGGHTGLWQWDSTRWPKVANWIKSKGGDPYSAEWQAKAWIAEHNAKPGDAIYDGRKTERGGRRLRDNPSLTDAITGVQESERFGHGEEGGRANNARRWLPHVNGASSPASGNRADSVSLRMRREMQAGDLGDLSELDVGGRGYGEGDRQPRNERAPDAQFDINHARESQRNSYNVMNDRTTYGGRSYADLMETGEALARRWRGEHGERSEFEPQRELTLDEIRKFAAPRRPSATGNVTGNINAPDAKMTALQAGARAAIVQQQAAQAAVAGRTSNDNRSATDNSSQWHIGEVNLHTQATDGRSAAYDFRDTIRGRSYAAAANRGLA